MTALAAAALALAVLVAGLAYLVRILDQVEFHLRGLVGGVRRVRRAVRHADALARQVGSDAGAGEAALEALADLKDHGRRGVRSGRLSGPDGEGVGPVSLVLRPHPVPGTRHTTS